MFGKIYVEILIIFIIGDGFENDFGARTRNKINVFRIKNRLQNIHIQLQ